jgi:hypothetical protein
VQCRYSQADSHAPPEQQTTLPSHGEGHEAEIGHEGHEAEIGHEAKNSGHEAEIGREGHEGNEAEINDHAADIGDGEEHGKAHGTGFDTDTVPEQRPY